MNGTNLDNLLRLVKLTGGKYVIVEDGEPKAVLMSYKEFEDLAEPGIIRNLTSRFENLAEEVNRKIAEAQASETSAEEIDLPEQEKEYSPRGEDIRLEPLS